MAIYAFIEVSVHGVEREVYILDGIEISGAEYTAVQIAALDRYCGEGEPV